MTEGDATATWKGTLCILEQETLEMECIRQHTKQTDKLDVETSNERSCIVVKNTPFKLRIGIILNELAERSVSNFSLSLELQLIYASNSGDKSDLVIEKAVDFIRKKPLQYVVTPIDLNQLEYVVEVKIKILSSQHEDMLFCLKIFAKEKQGLLQVSPAYSNPIRVVSKPPRLLKRKFQATPESTLSSLEEDLTKKRSYQQMVADSARRVEAMQELQKEEISKALCHMEKSVGTVTTWFTSGRRDISQQNLDTMLRGREEEVDLFLAACFEKVIKEFGLLFSREEKTRRVKRFLTKAKQNEAEAELREIFQVIREEIDTDEEEPPPLMASHHPNPQLALAERKKIGCYSAPPTSNVKIASRTVRCRSQQNLVTSSATPASPDPTSATFSSPLLSLSPYRHSTFCSHQRELAHINAMLDFIKSPPPPSSSL